MSKKILKVSFDFDITLIGISSSLKDYRLCWFINKHLPLKFERIQDLEIYSDFGEVSFHSCFKFSYDNIETDLYIISNKNGPGYIIPESKETDYFMLSTESLNSEEEKAILNGLKKIDTIQSAYLLDPYSFKSRENLLFF